MRPIPNRRKSTKVPSPRQVELLRFIAARIAGGLPPTNIEIAKHLGVRSTNCVAQYVRALQRKGLLVVEPCRARAMRLTARGEVYARGAAFVAHGVAYMRVSGIEFVAPSAAA
jgi:SOS-response transcriptional repressor LexA